MIKLLGYGLLGGLTFAVAMLYLETELAAGVSLFLLLVVFQLRFLITRLRPKSNNPPPAVDAQHAAGLIKAMQQRSKQMAAKNPVASFQREEDNSVFSQFQKNLNEQTRLSTIEPDDEVVVSLSSSKKKIKVKAEPIYEEEEPSPRIQARPKPKPVAEPRVEAKAEPKASPPAPKKGREAKENSLIDKIPVAPLGELFEEDAVELEKKPSKPRVIQPRERRRGVGKNAPIEAREVLTSEDLEFPPPDPKQEQRLLYDSLVNKLETKEYESAMDTIALMLEQLDWKTQTDLAIDLYKKKAQAEFALNRFEEHQKTYEAMFRKLIPKTDPEFLPTMEKVMDQYIKANKQKEALHFFYTALREYKELKDYRRMDVTYYHIEEAYRQVSDFEALVKTYSSHLLIKKELEDLRGQLPILDHLGKLLYDQGDQTGSRECYEQAVMIKEKLSAS